MHSSLRPVSGATILVLLLAVFTAASADWVSVGPDGGRFDAGAGDPRDPGTIYVVPYMTGSYTRVHRSTDGGVSWEALGQVPYTYTPYVLLPDPYADSLMYLVASGNRFLRSTDRGMTWTYAALPLYTYWGVCDRSIPGRIYVTATTARFRATHESVLGRLRPDLVADDDH